MGRGGGGRLGLLEISFLILPDVVHHGTFALIISAILASDMEFARPLQRLCYGAMDVYESNDILHTLLIHVIQSWYNREML